MPNIPEDPTIYVGMRLYDGTDYDTVIERVEYGGFGVIAFGPNRLRDGRMTAYKTLRRELLDDPKTRASFLRECLLWVGLWGHSNVATAYGAVEMHDSIGIRPFLVLEYAEHGSLRSLLRAVATREPNHRLPLNLALHLAQQITAGLAYLHRPEPTYLRTDPTVHRDLKPENALLIGDGRLVITDFGLAKAIETSPASLARLLSPDESHDSSETTGSFESFEILELFDDQLGSPEPGGRQAVDAILVEEAILISHAEVHETAERALPEESLFVSHGWVREAVEPLVPEQPVLEGSESQPASKARDVAEVAFGTIPYIPPEQWEDSSLVGPPADIYALGIMLSEVFAGRHALLDLDQPHSQADWRFAHRNPRPRPIRDVAPDVPVIVEAIYQSCLTHDPGKRPTAHEVLVALQAGARAAGQEVYTPPEMLPHTSFNEFAHWHNWAIAYSSFGLYREALARNDRALPIARQLSDERPDVIAATLSTRGAILNGLGTQAMAAGKTAEAIEWDRQTEEAYQESLMTRPPASTPEGRRGRAHVWLQIGIFNNERKRYAHANDAYARALDLQSDMVYAYFNRALNQARWGMAEMEAGHREAGIAHLRQARVYAVTALGLGDPTAQRLIESIETNLQRFGATG